MDYRTRLCVLHTGHLSSCVICTQLPSIACLALDSLAQNPADSPEGSIVPSCCHHAVLIHCHSIHNGLLVLEDIKQKFPLQAGTGSCGERTTWAMAIWVPLEIDSKVEFKLQAIGCI